jgi:L-arabinonolactonase
MNQPGRSLRWDAAGSRWWWSSESAPALHVWSPSEQRTFTCRLPDKAALLAQTRSGRLLLGLAKRLCVAELPAALRDSQQLRVRPLVAVDAAEPRTSITDGCVDRRGFLVFGTGNVGQDRRPIGSFYQYSRQHGLRRLALPAVARASSIAFSGDGKRMYFADAAQPRILCCAYDAEQGSVADIGLFAALADGVTPRGTAVDQAGCVWNAQPGWLVQYEMSGKPLQRFAIAAKRRHLAAQSAIS